MKARIEPGNISGTVTAPSSKSMTQRAYAAALLHKGKTIIYNAGRSDDELAALQIIQHLGAKIIFQSKEKTEVVSNGIAPVKDTIQCGESGLAARLFSPIAAMSAQAIHIEGAGSLLRRPMEGFAEMFSALGVTIEGFNGYLPFRVQGPLAAATLSINAAGGSQLLSGLLFALSGIATKPVAIAVEGLKSKPYIDLTLQVLKDFGKPVAHDSYKAFYIDPTLFTYKETIEINIEGDWSSAATLLVAGAIAGDITVKNLNTDSLQADKAILDVLRSAGAVMSVDNNCLSVKRSPLHAFEFDATDCPDLFPVLSVLAACCKGESTISGVHRLFNKESNRAESIAEMLQNFDVAFSIEDDTLCISGVNKLQGTVIDSCHDHRIVMAAATGALRASGPVDILNAEAVNKSYPDFFRDFVLCCAKYSG